MNAVWGKGLLQKKNIQLVFQYRLTPETSDRLELAVSNLYRFFVAGKLVGYGPARAAHGYSRLDTYDLSPWAGQEVTLTVEVYSANVNTYYTIDEAPFFAAELYRSEERLAQAEDFTAYHMTGRVQKVQRFGFQRSFVESYRFCQNPADFYAGKPQYPVIETETVSMNKLLPRYVSYPTLQPISAQIIETGCVSLQPDAEVIRYREYLDVDEVLIKGFYPAELEEDIAAEVAQFALCKKPSQGELTALTYRTYQLPRTITGFFSFGAQVKEKTTLYLLFDEVATETENCLQINPRRIRCCNVVKYVLTPGNNELLRFEANSARLVTAVVTEGCTQVSHFAMVRYENPDILPLQDYGNPELNAIVEAASYTFAQNAVDILMDCPSRERAGWLCDSYFSGRAEHFFTGDNKVEKSFLENYALYTQQPGMDAGMIPMCYPADHPNGRYIPNWSMWYILELQSYVERTGDMEMKARSEQKVRDLLNFFQKYENEYGLLEDLDGWVFVEWSKCNDPEFVAGVNFPTNMLWAAALEATAKLYGWEGLTEKAAAMKKAIRELSYNGEFFEDNVQRDANKRLKKVGHTTETCQYYAFYFGIATPESYPELWQKLCSQFGPRRDKETVHPLVYPSNAIVGNYLRLELLLAQGYIPQVLQECKDFFTQMAQLTGTLWEHSRLSASLNHGFASVAAVYIHQCIK